MSRRRVLDLMFLHYWYNVLKVHNNNILMVGISYMEMVIICIYMSFFRPTIIVATIFISLFFLAIPEFLMVVFGIIVDVETPMGSPQPILVLCLELRVLLCIVVQWFTVIFLQEYLYKIYVWLLYYIAI